MSRSVLEAETTQAIGVFLRPRAVAMEAESGWIGDTWGVTPTPHPNLVGAKDSACQGRCLDRCITGQSAVP